MSWRFSKFMFLIGRRPAQKSIQMHPLITGSSEMLWMFVRARGNDFKFHDFHILHRINPEVFLWRVVVSHDLPPFRLATVILVSYRHFTLFTCFSMSSRLSVSRSVGLHCQYDFSSFLWFNAIFYWYNVDYWLSCGAKHSPPARGPFGGSRGQTARWPKTSSQMTPLEGTSSMRVA